MKKVILLISLLGATLAFAQEGRVGINTPTPAATLDVVGKPAEAGTVDGVIVPRLTGDQLKAKDAVYLAAQTGTIVYATAAAVPTTAKTINVTSAGQYYFDGSVWQRMSGSTPGNTTSGPAVNCASVSSDVTRISKAIPSGSSNTTVNVTAAEILTALNALPNGGTILIETPTVTTYNNALTSVTVELPSAAAVIGKRFLLAFDGPAGSRNILNANRSIEILVKATESNSLYYRYDDGTTIPKFFLKPFPSNNLHSVSELDNTLGQSKAILIYNSVAIEAVEPLTWSFTDRNCWINTQKF